MINHDVVHWPNGNKKYEEFSHDGAVHREDGPAYRVWFENGSLSLINYYVNDQLHRENNPAYYSWYDNGKLQCLIWYYRGKRHNLNGPAYLYWEKDGTIKTIMYHMTGKIHRTNGPAYITKVEYGFHNEFHIDGKKIDSDWFTQLGKDIYKDFSDEATRDMIINIFQS